MKVWQHPPAWSCCSRISTFFPALAKMAPAAIPPIPLPMMTASRSSGTLDLAKLSLITRSRFFWSRS